MIAEIIGPDLLIVLAIALVVFGGSQIPKLARGLGSAHREFQKGLSGDDEEEQASNGKAKAAKPAPAVDVQDAVPDKELPAPAAEVPPQAPPAASPAPNGQQFN